jgi:hypothetical protein
VSPSRARSDGRFHAPRTPVAKQGKRQKTCTTTGKNSRADIKGKCKSAAIEEARTEYYRSYGGFLTPLIPPLSTRRQPAGYRCARRRFQGRERPGFRIGSDALCPDAATESQVYRLTDPSYTSTLPAAYNRMISRNSGLMLFCCDRAGSPQAFRIDLKSGETHQLTDRKDVDGTSLTLLPDSRSFCYFAERTLYLESLSTLKDRAIYTIPEGWGRCPGLNIGADGAHAVFGETHGDGSRLRSVALIQGAVRTILETPFSLADPMERR